MKHIFTALSAMVLAGSLLVPAASHAQIVTPELGDDYGLTATVQQTNLPQGTMDPVGIAARIINILLGVLGVIMVVIVLYAGYLWMTAGGAEEKIRTAQAMLRNAIIGILIILAAYAISSFVIRQISNATSASSRRSTQ